MGSSRYLAVPLHCLKDLDLETNRTFSQINPPWIVAHHLAIHFQPKYKHAHLLLTGWLYLMTRYKITAQAFLVHHTQRKAKKTQIILLI